MSRPLVALVVGFTKRPGLLKRSFEPLLCLKQKQVITRILYVTWDKLDLDPWVAEAQAMPEVEILRVPEPAVEGPSYQKKFFYQTYNIAAGLERIPGNPLVLKTRPDVVFDLPFLAAKLLSYDYACTPTGLPQKPAVPMPAPAFASKIWLPWADSNQPFFFEDGVYLGLRNDLAKLVTPDSDEIVRSFGDENSKWIVHVARFIVPFLADYPILQKYIENFHLFAQPEAFRKKELGMAVADAYFWNLLIANAYILAANFHIDCGYQGQITFFPPEGAEDTQAGLPLDAIRPRNPYDTVEGWRVGQKPGEFAANVLRTYGRLMDDTWQHALFAREQLADLPRDNLEGVLNCLQLYGRGVLADVEKTFYANLKALHGAHFGSAALCNAV